MASLINNTGYLYSSCYGYAKTHFLSKSGFIFIVRFTKRNLAK